MLIDVKKKRNEQTEQAELWGSTHDPQTQTHAVTAELGEGRGRHRGRDRRDRDRPLPTCPENPTLTQKDRRPLERGAPLGSITTTGNGFSFNLSRVRLLGLRLVCDLKQNKKTKK
jgi:hypothetical protein